MTTSSIKPPLLASLAPVVTVLQAILAIFKAMRAPVLPRGEVLILPFHPPILVLVAPGIVVAGIMRDWPIRVRVGVPDLGGRLRHRRAGYRRPHRLYRGKAKPRQREAGR